MSQYQKILVAIDLSEDSTPVVQRAHALAEANGAELHLIHVIEPLSFAYGGDIPMDFSGIQEEIHQQATQQMRRFAEKNNIDEQHQTIVLGKPEVEIHETAKELEIDRKTVETALRLLEKDGLLVGQGAGRRRKIVLPEQLATPALRVAILDYEPFEQTEEWGVAMQQQLMSLGHSAFFTPLKKLRS